MLETYYFCPTTTFFVLPFEAEGMHIKLTRRKYNRKEKVTDNRKT